MSEENMMFATEDQQLSALTDEIEEVAKQKFLTFYTSNLLFGLEAENVVEIITNYPITRVPMVPIYVRGIINLRGQTIPIIDMRLRLNIEPIETDRIIVITVDDAQVGLLVDSICRIIDIPVSNILPVPANNAQKYVSGMCALPEGEGTMLVLDTGLVLAD